MSENNYVLPKRNEINSKYKWNLEIMYETLDEWEKEYKEIEKEIGNFSKFKGTLSQNAEILSECLREKDIISAKVEKLFVYAKMKRDEDNSNSIYQALTDRASFISTNVSTVMSFIVPEIIRIPEETLFSYINSNDELKKYMQFFKEILREREHTLSEEMEKVLAMSYEVLETPQDIFTMFNNADIRFPFIKNEDGKEVELTKGRYVTFLESEDRKVRESAFKALYKTYEKNINTIATMLVGNLKSEKFVASMRKYNSSIEGALSSDNIKVEVYDNLIKTIDDNLFLLQEYLEVRKRRLKIEELHMYDLYVPLIKNNSKNITFEEATKIVLEALSPLGQEYIKTLDKGIKSGWIDVFENQGKTSGAYSWGTYLSQPYVLLNYQSNINDVFTLAHELGHSMHSFYTNKTQPYVYSHYKIFVAEVASTVNELLLMNYLLKTTKEKNERAYILNHYLESFRGTVFRQVMFAEFEKTIHSKIWNGEPLSAETLNDIYKQLNIKYFGKEVVVDDEIKMEWARIPHFYSSFYVYKYATGFSAACSLSKQILEEGEVAVKRYIEFLKSGSSDYPIEILKKAGVDLSTPKPVQDALDIFNELLDEFKEI